MVEFQVSGGSGIVRGYHRPGAGRCDRFIARTSGLAHIRPPTTAAVTLGEGADLMWHDIIVARHRARDTAIVTARVTPTHIRRL